jgi:hypothetical protein
MLFLAAIRSRLNVGPAGEGLVPVGQRRFTGPVTGSGVLRANFPNLSLISTGFGFSTVSGSLPAGADLATGGLRA